jgi:predicted nucleic acid-binding protein
MSRVFWDTMLFIYWIEDHPQHGPRVREIFTSMQERHDSLCTSALTMGETLAGPYRKGAQAVIQRIEEFFASPSVEVISFTPAAAVHFARIRSKYAIRPPDAIQLACAANAGIDLFLTNDSSLIGKVVPGIQFVTGLDTNLL